MAEIAESVPEGIPQDVPDGDIALVGFEAIARAILAERERCAKIADEERAKWRGSGAKGAARNIATSIRQGSPK